MSSVSLPTASPISYLREPHRPKPHWLWSFGRVMLLALSTTPSRLTCHSKRSFPLSVEKLYSSYPCVARRLRCLDDPQDHVAANASGASLVVPRLQAWPAKVVGLVFFLCRQNPWNATNLVRSSLLGLCLGPTSSPRTIFLVVVAGQRETFSKRRGRIDRGRLGDVGLARLRRLKLHASPHASPRDPPNNSILPLDSLTLLISLFPRP
jgi:hypothetical protein